MNPEQRQLHDALVKKLVDEGRIVEAGFWAMRAAVIAPNAPEVQVDEMRLAYMAGAQHLFASIMTMFDPGEEATEGDLNRVGKIANELNAWVNERKLKRER